MANESARNVSEVVMQCDTVSDLDAILAEIMTELNTALVEIDAIEGESAAQNRDICQKLQSAAAQAQRYSAMVRALHTIANQERIATLNQQLKCQPPNQQPLKYYISELERAIGRVKPCYSEFFSACNTATELTNEAIEKIENKAIAARTKKRAARVLGGTATTVIVAGGVGAGVILSVVAGVFTFGVGTIVGLSATAVGAAATAVGVGGVSAAVTQHIASDYAETETAYRLQKGSVASLQKIRTKMQQAVQKIHRKVEVIEDDIDLIKNSMDNQESLRYPLSRLNENLSKLDRQPNLDQEPQATERED